jgi:hypothetical protein
MKSVVRSWTIAVLVTLLGACSSLQPPVSRHIESGDRSLQDCAQLFATMDERIQAAGVQDAEFVRIEGFPYLRNSRFLATFAAQAGHDAALFTSWVDALREADMQARTAEWRNAGGAATELPRAAACGRRLAEADLREPAAREDLLAHAAVPDSYLDGQRLIGFYALTRVPFSGGVHQWHEEARGMFRQSREGRTPFPQGIRYRPGTESTMSRAEVGTLLQRGVQDPMGRVRLSHAEEARLLATYAPVFELETAAAYDKPGAPRWQADGRPGVDSAQPVVYTRIAYTRAGGRTLLQLVYTMWFDERPANSGVDILAGRLDGLVWRVTLSPSGEPLVYDTMHPCGCYHMFFPTALASARPAPDPDDEWVLAPLSLPRIAEGERIRLRLATRSHYLIDVLPEKGVDRGTTYQLQSDSRLRHVAAPGGTRSLYGPDGLVEGTERAERLLFWPMGIASAGAMRQWGTHATAFLGRRHFDDADLLEQRFQLQLD